MRSLSLLLLPALAACQDAHAAIQSSRGVQHKAPLISDDFVVGCIMIMFLMLFAFGMQYHELHFFHEPFGDHDCRVPNLTSSRHRLWCMFAHRQAVRSVLGQKRGFEDLLFAIEYYSNAAFHSAFVCGVNVRVCTELILPTRSIFGDCARPFLHSELRPEPSCSLYTHSCCSISCVAVGPCRLRRGPRSRPVVRAPARRVVLTNGSARLRLALATARAQRTAESPADGCWTSSPQPDTQPDSPRPRPAGR